MAPRTFCELSGSMRVVVVVVVVVTLRLFERKFCKLCELFVFNGVRVRFDVAAFDSDSKSVSPKNRKFGWLNGLKSGDGDWAR